MNGNQRPIRGIVPRDNLAFEQKCITFYVAGPQAAQHNFANLMDSYFLHRKAAAASGERWPPQLRVTIAASAPADIGAEIAGLEVPTTMLEVQKAHSIPFYKAAPPFGSKHLVINVQLDGETDEVDFLFSGNTWALKTYFNQAGVDLRQDSEGNYFRAMTKPLAAAEDTVSKLQALASTLIVFKFDEAPGCRAKVIEAIVDKDDQFHAMPENQVP